MPRILELQHDFLLGCFLENYLTLTYFYQKVHLSNKIYFLPTQLKTTDSLLDLDF